VLPDLDDAFASEASEFETLAELEQDLRDRSVSVKKVQAQMALREKTGEVLAELVEDEIPDALVSQEMQQRLQDLSMRLEAQGMNLDTWIAMSGKQPDEVVEELRETATTAVRVDLALRAVAEAEAIECTDEDLEQEFAQVAERLNIKAKEVRRQFERAEQVPAVRSDVKKRKAFDWLLERVEIVDEHGTTIDRADLELPDTSDDAADDPVGTDDDNDKDDE
jgi:trigger factor